jgi:hypothetical protein
VLSSPRLRRRLLWAGAGVAACGAVVLAFALWPRAEEVRPPVDAAGPVLETAEDAEPVEVPLTATTRSAVLAVAQRFLTSAVVREGVGDSWEVTHPDLRQGISRREWTSGDIPVVPYPVDTARWRLGYSQDGVVGLEVYVVPEAGSSVRPMVFDMEVKSEGRRWLVSNWAPRVAPGGPAPPEPSPERVAAAQAAEARADENALGSAWLLAPIVAVLGVLALPLFLGLRDRRRARHGERLYAEHEARRDA